MRNFKFDEMKIIILIFSLILEFTIVNAQSPVNDIKIAMRESDFVGFICYSDYNSSIDRAILIVKESFKGDVKYLGVIDVEDNFKEGVDYLLIANNVNGLVTKITYPIIRVEKLSNTEIDILNNLECYSESLKSDYINKICYKDLDSVCGCDNKNYGNICEMRKSGILRFKPGMCK